MEPLLPKIGSSGVFKVSAPFDRFVVEKISYTCTSIRSITEIQTYTRSVLDEYYLFYGLTAEDYHQDILNNELIVSLRNGSEFIYVPSKFILSYPDVTGIPYHVLSLAVTLGAIPVGTDLSVLKDKIEELVITNIGLTPITEEVEVSATKYFSEEEHNAAVQRRAYLTTDNSTDLLRYREALSNYELALLRIRELETFISTTYAVGKVNSECTGINHLKATRDRQTNKLTVENGNGFKLIVDNEFNLSVYRYDVYIFSYHDKYLNFSIGILNFKLINQELINSIYTVKEVNGFLVITTEKLEATVKSNNEAKIINDYYNILIDKFYISITGGNLSFNTNGLVTNLTLETVSFSNSDLETVLVDKDLKITLRNEKLYVRINNTVQTVIEYNQTAPTPDPTLPPTPTTGPTPALGTIDEFEENLIMLNLVSYNKFNYPMTPEELFCEHSSAVLATDIDLRVPPSPVLTLFNDYYFYENRNVLPPTPESLYLKSPLENCLVASVFTEEYKPLTPPTPVTIEDHYFTDNCKVVLDGADTMYLTRNSDFKYR